MIPEGYRLLTSADVGKVFGVDLELEVYIDTEISLTDSSSIFTYNNTNNLTNFIKSSYLYNPGYEANVAKIECTQTDNYILWEESVGGWYVAYGNIITMFESTEITSFNTEIENWNTWFYVKDISNPYNITSSKPKITINCKGKFMTKDLTITRELWDGSYEEISNGYTLTLDIATDALNNELYTYSINNGATFNQFTNSNMVLENVSKIIIKNDGSIYAIGLAYASGSVFGGVSGGTQEEFIIEENTQWSISLGATGGAN